MRQLPRTITSLVAVALLAACAQASPSPGGALRVEDRDGDFLVAIETPRLVWGVNEPIAVSAELSYLGPGSVTVFGPGPGPHVVFEVLELTGTRQMGAAWHQACRTWDMTRAPLAIPFNKSVGYSAEDPHAAFYKAYFADPAFRLPAGHWKVSALAPFSVGACDGESVDLRAGFTLTVR